MPASPDITELLIALSKGDRQALDQLLPVLYEELRQIAHAHLLQERKDHTLDTAALVHEAYLKLVQVNRVQWQDRAHFCAMASRVMRRILIDYARGRMRVRRGGDLQRVSVDEVTLMPAAQAEDLIALDEALERFTAVYERACRVIECRFFGGLNVEETAEALGISSATVKRDWALGRAWLNRELASS